MKPATSRRVRPDDDVIVLRNIGVAMRDDLHRLGIMTVGALAGADADGLYLDLCRETGTRQDPCVHDTFAAAIHQAKAGEALAWWSFTPARKARQAAGSFVESRRVAVTVR